ncbi:hypothetical protein ACLB2K_045745 [Fragaria x ananassa]
MATPKSLRFDGLSAGFCKQYWEIVGEEVSNFCLGVLNEGKDIGEAKHTLICLIPKVPELQRTSDFQPISLCTVLYKLISKAIVNRMKGVLDKVISQDQSAFVPRRHIHDNVIMAFETVHSIKMKFGPEAGY